MYEVFPYYLSNAIIDMPVLIINPFLFQVIVYWGCGFAPSYDAFFSFSFALLLVTQFSSALGYFVSALFSSMESASIGSPLFVSPLILFGGFLSNGNTY